MMDESYMQVEEYVFEVLRILKKSQKAFYVLLRNDGKPVDVWLPFSQSWIDEGKEAHVSEWLGSRIISDNPDIYYETYYE
jgi:hypothetical protein